MTSRRTFLKTSGLLTAGLMLQPSDLMKMRGKAGIQLYSLRDIIGKDPKTVIGQVAQAGYKEVEMYGLTADTKFFGMTVPEFANLLKANKLTSPSGHYAPEKFLFDNGNGDDVKRLCDVGHQMGHEYIVIPYLTEDRRKTIEQYKVLAARINLAGKIVKESGLQLAYHNHDFEFADHNGQKGYDVLLKSTDPDLLKMESDLYWIVRAGYDPIDLFKANPGRFPMWHVKDMDKLDRTKNTEVGNGSIDFKNIFKYVQLAGAKHFYMEQENNYKPDFIGSVSASSKYMKKKLLS